MQKIIHNLKWLTLSIAMGIAIGGGLIAVKAWTEPTVAPPGGNVGAPINTSNVMQDKTGALRVTGFRNYNATVLDGSVGIGTTTPTQKLDVAGYVKGTGVCIGADCRTAWPASGSSYTAGTGISISGTTITNTGDTNPNDDITSLTAGTGISISGSGNSRIISSAGGTHVSSGLYGACFEQIDSQDHGTDYYCLDAKSPAYCTGANNYSTGYCTCPSGYTLTGVSVRPNSSPYITSGGYSCMKN